MNTSDNDKNKSFADILLQAALNAASSDKQAPQNPTMNSTKSFWHLVGYVVGFLLYCLMFHLGCNVAAAKFSLEKFTFLESVQVCLGIVSFRALLSARK
jgi:hypothetical protein